MSEWWAALTTIEKTYVCFAFPFTLLTVIQLIFEMLGLGDHSGGDTDFDSGGFDHSGGGFLDHFGFFSVRNLIYFMMMFGWTGLAFSKIGMPIIISMPLGVIAGLLTTVIIGWIFFMMSKLTETGNTEVSSAVGKIGKVYLPIPEKRKGNGVIQVVMQGSTQELEAITDGEKLVSGTSVQVIEVMGANLVLVIGSDVFEANK